MKPSARPVHPDRVILNIARTHTGMTTRAIAEAAALRTGRSAEAVRVTLSKLERGDLRAVDAHLYGIVVDIILRALGEGDLADVVREMLAEDALAARWRAEYADAVVRRERDEKLAASYAADLAASTRIEERAADALAAHSATIDELRQRMPGRPLSRRDSAEAFLLTTLGTGPARGAVVLAAAAEAGHSPRTIERAKEAAGIVSCRGSWGHPGQFATSERDAA